MITKNTFCHYNLEQLFETVIWNGYSKKILTKKQFKDIFDYICEHVFAKPDFMTSDERDKKCRK